MWKFTGMPRSAHAAQSGSQCRSARSGNPWFCGSELVLMPRSPSACTRATSATAASMSHQGRIAIGYMRPPDSSWSSAMASL